MVKFLILAFVVRHICFIWVRMQNTILSGMNCLSTNALWRYYRLQQQAVGWLFLLFTKLNTGGIDRHVNILRLHTSPKRSASQNTMPCPGLNKCQERPGQQYPSGPQSQYTRYISDYKSKKGCVWCFKLTFTPRLYEYKLRLRSISIHKLVIPFNLIPISFKFNSILIHLDVYQVQYVNFSQGNHYLWTKAVNYTGNPVNWYVTIKG